MVKDVLPSVYTTTMMEDIRDTLNANGGRVTDDLTSFFKAAANNNPWSKDKVMHIPNRVGVATSQEKKTAGSGEPSVNRYGLTLVGGKGTTPNVIFALMHNDRGGLSLGAPEGFTYKLPTGTEASPYRLSDFCGYYPAASAPIASIYSGEVILTPPVSANLSGYDLSFFNRTNVDADKEITFDDLYPPTDADGNSVSWKQCLYVVESGNTSNTKVFYEHITGEWLYNNKGKTFYAVQFMSTTQRSNERENIAWDESWQFAMPFPIFQLTVASISSGGSGSEGNEGVQGDIIVQMDSSYPVFNGLVGDALSQVYAPFTLNIRGGTGAVKNFSIALYTASTCALTERVSGSLVAFDDLVDASGSIKYNPRLSNNNRLSPLWVGIYFNGNKQFTRKVLLPKEEI